MGSYEFTTNAPGASAQDAFQRARDDAAYENGHGGYTGTIAEKDSFVMVSATPLPYSKAALLAARMIEEDDERISDKWGPAGCVPIEGGEWLFFGWASS